ncbi:endo-13(4)-beta-glucanase 1-like [Trifolium medium]|uniref:glucan endo-1,3-beta-D-glucosidase n=1 Tax=Trifolium medium TaxID=97028 RepID=A0A392MZL9_9FABA|nr:endo-13(4)-beta-glucanase 1-like [Trifolium medium]
MLAHPLHVELLPKKDSRITVLSDFKYKSIDGKWIQCDKKWGDIIIKQGSTNIGADLGLQFLQRLIQFGMHEIKRVQVKQAVNAYYSAALIGMAYDDVELVATASTLTSLEILSAKMWWHVKEGANMYERDFTKNNKVITIASYL